VVLLQTSAAGPFPPGVTSWLTHLLMQDHGGWDSACSICPGAVSFCPPTPVTLRTYYCWFIFGWGKEKHALSSSFSIFL
jgi:hypothetical protein